MCRHPSYPRRPGDRLNVPASQRETLAIIASMTLIRGHAPTQAEIAALLGVTSQAISRRIAWMRKKGLLRVVHESWSASSGLSREGIAAMADMLHINSISDR